MTVRSATVVGAVAAGLLLIVGLAVSVWNDPYRVFAAPPRLPPGSGYLLGTDALGRDVLARLVAGAVPTLAGGLAAELVTLSGAILLGTSAAFAPRRWARPAGYLVITSLLSMPSILIAMVILTVLDRSSFSVAIAAGFSHIPLAAVVLRDQILATSSQLHVTAARSLGARRWRLFLFHIVPVASPVLVAYALSAFASNLLLMTSLSFLGFNGDVASPEWGSMIADGRLDLRGAPWAVAAPAGAIVLVVGCLTVVARSISRD